MNISPMSALRRYCPAVRRRALIVASIATVCAAALATTAAPRPPIAAQAPRLSQGLTFTPAGRFGGPFEAVAADGTRAFAVRSGAVEAYDVADPAAPRWLGVSKPIAGLTHIAAGSGRVAAVGVFVAAGDPTTATLTLLDAGGGAPQVASTIELGSCDAHAVQTAAGIVAVACGPDGVRLVDARDAGRPTVVTVDSFGRANAVALDGRRLLVGKAVGANGAAGEVMFYDVADPALPRLVDAAPRSDPVTAIGLAGDRAVVVASDGNSVRIAVVRLGAQDRWSVVAERAYDSGWSTGILAGQGTRFQVAFAVWLRGESRVVDIDTARPETPWVGELHFAWGTRDVATLPTGTFVSDARRGLVAYGRDDAGALFERGHVASLTHPYGAAFQNDDLVVADDDAELWTLDTSTPASVVVLGSTTLAEAGAWPASIPTYGGGLAIDGHLAYVTRGASFFNMVGSVAVVDVSDVASPRSLSAWSIDSDQGPLKLPKEAYGLDMSRNYDPVAISGGLLTMSSGGVTELDTADPSSPHFRRLFRDMGSCYRYAAIELGSCSSNGVVVDGQMAYAAQGLAGVRVYDLRPGAPTSAVRTFEGPDGARDIAIVGDALLVVHEHSSTSVGLRVIDRRTGEAVRSVDGFDGYRIKVIGETAYVVAALPDGGGSAILAFDVTDPFTPVERGRLELHGAVDDWNRPPHVAVMRDLLAVVSMAAGVQLFRLTDAEPIPAVDPGPTVTPWPTWSPPDPRTPSPTSEVQPLPTATSERVSTVVPVPGDGDERLFVPFAARPR